MPRSAIFGPKDRIQRPTVDDRLAEADLAAQRARLLDAGLAGVLAAEAFYILLLLLVRQVWTRQLAINGAVIVVFVLLRSAARRGHVFLASLAALVAVTGVVAWSAWGTGGVRAPAVAAFLILILCSGLVFGTPGAIVGGVVSTGITLGLVFLGRSGRLPEPHVQSDITIWAAHASYAILAMFLVGLIVRHQLEALGRARGELVERERAERALRESEERLRTLIAGVSDVVTVHDGNGVVVYESPSADRLFGFGTNALVGRSAFDVVHPDDRPIVRTAFEDVAKGGSSGVPTCYRVVRADGQPLYVESVARGLIESSHVHGIVLVTRNIDARRKAEAETERWLAETSLVSTVAGLILELDDEDALLAAVERALRGAFPEACGLIPATASGQLPAQAEALMRREGGSPEGPPRLVVEGRPGEDAGLLDPEARSGVFVPLRAGDKLLGLLAFESPEPRAFGGDDVRLLGIVASQVATAIERLHIRRAHETTIAELELRNAELERFTYTVSHDLKSPLTTIKGFLGYVEAAAREGRMDKVGQDLARIESAADRMHVLLDDLLQLSRVGRVMSDVTTFPSGDVAREAVELVAGRIAASSAKVMVQDGMPPVTGARARLVEAFQNLVDNAVKFSRDSAEPRVEVGHREAPDGRPIFFVRDNGIGIEARYHERVFGLFDKLDARSEGTGVGLALVKRIVELHGGQIWVESAGTGQGTELCFTLPGPLV